ncbi:membrane dipeptidase [Novosphingobium sp. PhB57]|uniref:dipeptidase n=1 Tax=Novosphingobium sp. PhB57 TaxID=2485107 RepID=UPI00104C23DF|nr:membrane dipeptidase [Novosphingobium sp. PhB57]TCU51768.1 membrane dipeptidase [Novosphingobium sp. PhB57]
MDRRQILGFAGAAFSAAAFAPVHAFADAAKGAQVATGGLLIDGNLMPPLDPDAPLDDAYAALVRSSGLTALKMTLGGSGNLDKAQTDVDIADIAKAIDKNPQLFTRIRSFSDFGEAKRTGKVGIIFSFEAGEMLEGKIENIDHFRQAGVLVMGLTYNRETPFGSGVLAKNPKGLTRLGHEAVARMNALGVSIDISHCDEATSFAAISASRVPVLVTHAGCAAVHSHPRNKSDALLRTLAKNGGVVGIYELSFLVPYPEQPDIAAYIAHLDHALRVCGEDHVGIGTDGSLTPFDTSPESMATWNEEIERRKRSGVSAPGEGPPPFVIGLNRPDRYSVIADAMAARGYRARTIEKVLGENFARAFADTWKAGPQTV